MTGDAKGEQHRKAGDDSEDGAEESGTSPKAPREVFRVFIRGTVDQVWRELTKTDEVQKAMFDSRMDTKGLEPGAIFCMRSPNGKYTAVVGRVIEIEEPVRFSHTFRFTSYDDPECSVVYDLSVKDGGVEVTMTLENLPVGTKTAKQMLQGGPMICKTLKAVIETGKPPIGTRLLYLVFKLFAPFNPDRVRSVHWSLD